MRKLSERLALSLTCAVMMISCGDNVSTTLGIASNNADELQRVINHYDTEDPNPLKREAALFLIENMTGHYSAASPALDSVACKVRQAEKITSDSMQAWWSRFRTLDANNKRLDAQTLKADYLIDNIDQAFKAWQSSPWHKEVDSRLFFRYILPYRLHEEPLAPKGWRDTLYQRYHPLIEGETDMAKAYATVYKHIRKEFAMRDISFPYALNPLDAGKMKVGKCIHQCLYAAAVMRSLGIPAVVDEVIRWANYSKVGHSWVALVRADGAYTVNGNDSIAKRGNPINSTLFSSKYPLEKDYPIATDFKKRVVKVWRINYELNPQREYADRKADDLTRGFFSYPFMQDVSADYGLTRTIKLPPMNADYCYLCTYATDEGWRPMAYAPRRFGRFEFTDIGDSIVYQPMVFADNGELTPVGDAFIADAHGLRYLEAAPHKRQQMVVDRKYPFVKSQLKMWIEAKGSHFEGANRPDFSDADTLWRIAYTPVYRNVIPLSKSKSYRYIRFVSSSDHRSPLSELEIYSQGNLLRGKPFSVGAAHPEACFDGDRATVPDGLVVGYSIGLDLGKSVLIDRLVYFLLNDDNFVCPGDDYQLDYYDRGHWRSLSVCKASGFSLSYGNVPADALYRLTDLTKGSEVRIFTYEKGRQVWW